MLNLYFLKVLTLALFSGVIFYLYYFIFPGHNEFNFSDINIFGQTFQVDKYFLFFIVLFSVIFFIYKFFQKNEEKIVFTSAKIIGFFLIFLFINCFFFFFYPFVGGNLSFENYLNIFSLDYGFSESFKNVFLLFGRIIYFSAFPIFLFLITTGFGQKITKFLPKIDNFSSNLRFLFSLNIGFFSFLFILTIFSFLGFYSLKTIFLILGFFLAFGVKEIFFLLKSFFTKKIILDKKEGNSIKLLLTEIFFLIAFFVISVGLILIIRPYPVGWDDLGVYMNFPNILAYSSGIASFGEMHTWQIFTGIGYLLGSPTFAFFLNFSGYILSFLTLNLIFYELFRPEKKSFLPLPIMLSTLFLSLPMSIFHSAKDMKLDQGLFFITVFIIFFLYKYLQKVSENKDFSKIYIFIIGILTGFVFSIKFTSLFLIISILALLSFFFLGFFGFLGFLSIFFSIFTAGNLWQMMNVAINQDLKLAGIFFIFGVFLLLFLFYKGKYNKKVSNYLKNIFIFLIGIIVVLLPWFTKNIYETYPNISISAILKGKADKVEFDLKKIFTEEEIKQKNLEKQESRKKDKITTNEDLRRYLGYESGIFPYTNIFWNLTMQTNQDGKFTEISYIFFALIPLIFIFLPFFRNKNLYFLFVIFAFFQLLFFIKLDLNLGKNPDFKNLDSKVIEKIFIKRKSGDFVLAFEDRKKLETKLEKENISEKEKVLEIWDENRNFIGKFKDFFAYINLPFGYLIIFFIFFLPFFILNYFLKNDEKTFIFRQNLAFSTVYIFLWIISSFSIAWYGIAMYFCLLLMICYGGFYISNYTKEDENEKYFGSLVFALIFLGFMIFTVFPHTVENFKSKNYLDYKTWKKSYISDIFDLHSNYDKIFFELNIAENKREDFLNDKVQNPLIPISKNEILKEKDFFEIIKELKKEAKKGNLESKKTLEKIYFGILYPEKKYLNNGKIFRIGTFLKYYIAENHKRVFEDGLLFYFNDYLYDKNPEKTWENLKNLGIKYLLVDLGTATIDDSEKHLLTIKYEKFLKNLRAENLKIIDTDSVCLRFATDNENIRKNEEKFFEVTNGTYESYDENDKKIYRSEKRKKCILEIEKYVNSDDFDIKKYFYLKKYVGKNFDEISKDFPKAKFVIYKIR